MSAAPQVSVVMGVYNGAETLPATMDSVLQQTGIDLELIIVNDGSSDETKSVLEAYAGRDDRVVLVDKTANQGLTCALRDGCARASSPLIARQDCGDRSLPGRLAKQAAILDRAPDLVLVAGGTRTVADGEVVQENCMQTATLRRGLGSSDFSGVFGPPHHGATMFRREAYERAGGYRAEFYFAQDLDLWLRLAEVGQVACSEAVLYEAALDSGSISGKHRKEQERLKELAILCRGARLGGGDELEYLQAAGMVRPGNNSHDPAAGEYFMARLLERVNRDKALERYRRALARNPRHWKSLVRSLQLRLRMKLQ